MTEVRVVVPFKGGGKKSRLSDLLTLPQRIQFSILLLECVLGAIDGAGLVAECFVVTSDARAIGVARRFGAFPLTEPKNEGVNEAVRRGIRDAQDTAIIAVVPSDLPLLSAGEITKSISFIREDIDLVLAPSMAFDGTNLLVSSREKMPRLSYDRDSFWNHLSDAAQRRMRMAVYTAPGFVFDVDTPRDFRALSRLRINNPAAMFAKRAISERES